MENIARIWGSDRPENFPGPQPVSIERRHFPALMRQPYFVCEKTDGVRHLLLSSVDGVVLVNRAWKTEPIKVRVPKDTLLDGEVVFTKTGKRLFVVHDAVLIKGENVKAFPLDKRLIQAQALVKSIIKTAQAPLEIRVKTMWPLEKIREMPRLDSFEYETDGLVFTPINEPIRSGTHETMFKWKPRERITIDFCLFKGFELFVQERGEPFKESELHLHNRRPDLPDGTIVECGHGPLGWFVEKVRTDKKHANNRRTYFRTIVNIRENIQFEEFLHLYHA
jgi:hypothetical protein